jgi:hypothetical protein
MKKLILITALLFNASIFGMNAVEYEETLNGWYGQANTQISESTWKNAVTWFINDCASSGQCNGCLLAVVENKTSGSGEMWLGTFSQQGPRTLLVTPVGLNTERTDAQKRRLARDGQCHTGGTTISCSGGTCTGGGGGHWQGRDLTAHATHYAQILNTSPSDITHYIYQYFSLQTSDSQELFHDGYIHTTRGCITQPLEQQIAMCRDVISPAGGIYLYADINQQLGQSSSKEAAARRLTQNPNWCNTLNVSPVTRVTSYAGPGAVFQQGGTVTPNNGPSTSTTRSGTPSPSPSSGSVSTGGSGGGILVGLLGAGAAGYAIYSSQDDEEEDEEESGPSYSAGSDLDPGRSISGDRPVMTGSERFRECQALSTTSYAQDVTAINNGAEATGRFQLATESGNSAAPFGTSQNNLQAAIFDNMDHDCMVQASLDSRSEAFLEGDSPLEDYIRRAREDGRDPNDPLIVSGEEGERNSPVREITPVAGLSQTIDNEDALNVADANLEMDMAEVALYQRNESDAISRFNSGATQYANDSDKQASANEFANIGTEQARLTATRIRDFHGAKATALTDHLDSFTTTNSALENCLEKYEPYRNKHPVWNRAMAPILPMVPQGFYRPPQYNGERCQSYLNWQKPYLFKNQHVVKEVNTIVDDSIQIVDGMSEVITTLGNRNLSESQRAKAFNHPIWKKVAAREKYLKKCQKNNCFAKKQKALFPLTRYEGYLSYRKPNLLQHQNKFTAYINGTELPKFNTTPNSKTSSSLKKLKEKLSLVKKKTKKVPAVSNPLNNGMSSSDQIAGRYSTSNSYNKSSFGEISRGKDGVLRNKSGKPVPGYEADKGLDLFEILSNRYRKKLDLLKK